MDMICDKLVSDTLVVLYHSLGRRLHLSGASVRHLRSRQTRPGRGVRTV